jgi:peptide/nickel transport system substrate-binding protein
MKSQARIFFDFNPPIDTNIVEHKIDRDAPSTKIKELGSETSSSNFDVEWVGSDKGSGISHVQVRVFRDDDSSNYQILDNTGHNSAGFVGEPNHEYSFVSIAVDNVGNMEIKSMPDTSTSIKQSQSQCLIATAAFGSELTPQVQFLRNFRDNHILSTAAGSSFMSVFNAWYYSFSPQVAAYERDQPWLQQTVKTAIYPLLGILGISEKAYFAAPGNYGAILAGLTTSSMIGAIYLAPLVLSIKQVRRRTFSFKPVITVLGSAAIALAIIILAATDATILELSTAGFVLTVLSMGTLMGARAIVVVSRYLSRCLTK